MTSLVEHDPKDGVLCWGGPQHESVVSIRPTDHVWEFPVYRRLTGRSMADPANPSMLSIQKVRYSVHKFAANYDNGDSEVWRVLVYGENEERLLKNFEGTTRLFFWWADPWAWDLMATIHR